MTLDCKHNYLFISFFLALWGVVFALPFARSLVDVFGCVDSVADKSDFYGVVARSFMFAGAIAAVSVLLGYIPGKLLAFSGKWKLLLVAMIVPLVLPRYVQYYCWSLLLSPTTALGRALSSNSDVANMVGSLIAGIVLVFWYWPIAGLLLASGWKNIGSGVLETASLETSKRQQFVHVVLPLLWRNISLCFLVCFVFALSEFGTFHLSGVRTIGTELAVIYELTGSEAAAIKAGWPMIVAALVVGYFLYREVLGKNKSDQIIDSAALESSKLQWLFVFGLVTVSVFLPLAILIMNIDGIAAFMDFFTLHVDELLWSLLTSVCAVVLACFLAAGAKKLDVFTGPGRVLRLIVYTSIFAGMLLPGSLVGVSLLKTANWVNADLASSWIMVSIGQAVRVCGIALILFKLSLSVDTHHYAEMASIDGAGPWSRFRYVYLSANKCFVGAVFLLLLMFCFAELPVTMILLGAGVPNFAQRLLNQMHYARDDQVIASCVILIAVFLIIAGFVVLLLKRAGRMRIVSVILLLCLLMSGCRDTGSQRAKVVNMFGATGRGKLEFVYPRAIEIAGDMLYVIDKVGRVQKITTAGEYVSEYSMPEVEVGKPTGISVGPDGNIYVADTHYHRVAVFDDDGKMINEFGEFGEEDGQFIYPTDVAFAEDGRIFVSEYGGNDRISVFDKDGNFMYTFAAHGDGHDQLSRPSAIYFDNAADLLYIADSCNHRIAVYTSDGQLVRYFGQAGTGPGQMRYPYDLAMTDDGELVVCEYGNNRVQVFTVGGESVMVAGVAGRDAGQLAYPWGVAVSGDKVFIVDAGNNRIQVWQF